MRTARIFLNNIPAGQLEESGNGKFRFSYFEDYHGEAISLTMPVSKRIYDFDNFPPFFDGLLPEGFQLEALLRRHKIDRKDYFTQLVTVGKDLVGAVTVEII